MKKLIFILLFALTIVLCMYSCNSDDSTDDQNLNLNESFLQANVNGDFFFATQGEQFESLSAILQNTFSPSLSLIALDANNAPIGCINGITLNLLSNDDTLITQGLMINGESTNFDLQIAFTTTCIDDETDATTFSSDTDVNLIITQIDEENQTISGSFSFTAVDAENNNTFIVTEGIINRIRYM